MIQASMSADSCQATIKPGIQPSPSASQHHMCESRGSMLRTSHCSSTASSHACACVGLKSGKARTNLQHRLPAETGREPGESRESNKTRVEQGDMQAFCHRSASDFGRLCGRRLHCSSSTLQLSSCTIDSFPEGSIGRQCRNSHGCHRGMLWCRSPCSACLPRPLHMQAKKRGWHCPVDKLQEK